MEYKLPPLPTPFRRSGQQISADGDDKVFCDLFSNEQLQAYAIAAIEAQGVPDGLALQIEAAVTQAQKVLSAWNEWYGMHGKNAPIPPAGIVNAQDLLAVARSLLASAPPAPQAKPQPLSDEQIENWWANDSVLEDCNMGKIDDFTKVVRAIEAAHGIQGS